MQRLKVGKLYRCSEYFLLLFPDKETASGIGAAFATSSTRAAAIALYWSEFDKPVIYCNPETPLLVLSADKKYVEVLADNQKGWFLNKDSLNIKEISCP